jgi:hypothetical protein
VYNIKMDLREIELGGMDWLSIGTSGGTCEHGYKPSGSIKCLDFLE